MRLLGVCKHKDISLISKTHMGKSKAVAFACYTNTKDIETGAWSWQVTQLTYYVRSHQWETPPQNRSWNNSLDSDL